MKSSGHPLPFAKTAAFCSVRDPTKIGQRLGQCFPLLFVRPLFFGLLGSQCTQFRGVHSFRGCRSFCLELWRAHRCKVRGSNPVLRSLRELRAYRSPRFAKHTIDQRVPEIKPKLDSLLLHCINFGVVPDKQDVDFDVFRSVFGNHEPVMGLSFRSCDVAGPH